MVGTILMLIFNLLPGILGDVGAIPPSIESLIAKLGLALPTLLTSLAANKGPTDVVLAIFTALKAEIAALGAGGVLSPNNAAIAASLTVALGEALKGYEAAKITTDPDSLTDLPESLAPAV